VLFADAVTTPKSGKEDVTEYELLSAVEELSAYDELNT
jgi:hypothetical protein